MKVRHLNCATIRPPGGRLVDGEPGVLRFGAIVCHCLLIETGAGLVLVDTGIGLRDIEKPVARLGREFVLAIHPKLDARETAARQIAGLGYAIEDVRHILLTHLDPDHAGGLSDFPKARVHVFGAEHRAAMRPGTRVEKTRYRKAQWEHGPDWVTYEPGGEPWFGFDAVRELTGLPTEILLVPLAGHTRGHAGVAVDTGTRWLLHAGDAYFFRGEADPEHTRSTPALRAFQSLVQHDRAARLGNQRRLRELVRDHRAKVEVFSAHDAVELRRHQSAAANPPT